MFIEVLLPFVDHAVQSGEIDDLSSSNEVVQIINLIGGRLESLDQLVVITFGWGDIQGEADVDLLLELETFLFGSTNHVLKVALAEEDRVLALVGHPRSGPLHYQFLVFNGVAGVEKVLSVVDTLSAD